MKAILVTGAAGFIGTNFIRMLLRHHGLWDVVALDALTYAGNLASLEDCCGETMLEFIRGDICDPALTDYLAYDIDVIVNFAAETDVDRSIVSSADFVRTNVEGVRVLANAAIKNQVRQFIQVSTAEVYGALENNEYFTEDSPARPRNPYAATKLGGDALLAAYFHTYGLPVTTIRATDTYGPYQFPEKMIPLFIIRAMENEPIPIYGDGLQVRDWIHVDDHCRAILAAIEHGKTGRIYNIASRNEYRNIDVARMILEYMGKDQSLIEHIADRPGHDRRYAADASKASKELNWSGQVDFKTGLHRTIDWYLEHRDWLNQVLCGQYMATNEILYTRRTVLIDRDA